MQRAARSAACELRRESSGRGDVGGANIWDWTFLLTQDDSSKDCTILETTTTLGLSEEYLSTSMLLVRVEASTTLDFRQTIQLFSISNCSRMFCLNGSTAPSKCG